MKSLKNENGFTIIEVVVCFVLIMLIAMGLLKISMSYRNRAQIEMIKNDMITYKNVLTKDIQTDIFEKGVLNMASCGAKCVSINFKDGTNKALVVGNINASDADSVRNKYIKYGDIRYPIKDNIPDSIPDGRNIIDFQNIILTTDSLLRATTVGPRTVYTIKIKIEHVDLVQDYGISIVTTVRN